LLHLLQPIWLFAIAGIIVPVAVHLWNDKLGKVLTIGSTAFLEKTSLKKARSRQLSEWLLLLLRCLLLIMLALLLAGPSWKKRAGEKGWVLVGGLPVGGVTRPGGGLTGMVDSLVREGYERHDLKDSCWWEAFASLDRQAPGGIPFYVFTDGYLRHFSGIRPATDRPVYWYTAVAGDSMIRWVDKRWSVGGDSVRMITGSSGPTGSVYGYEQMVRRPGDSIDTTTLHVGVYADGIDGQWVMAALRAIQQFTRRKIIIDKKVMGADWVFWLSSQPLPTDLKAANIVMYEQGKAMPVDTWVRDMDVQVEKVIEAHGGGLQPVWTDGFGRTLLGVESAGGGRRYHFFSHFDPAWNGLVWSADLPFYLQALLFERTDSDHDRRGIDPGQGLPGKGVAGERTMPVEASIDLAPAGWLLVWLLLLVERMVAFRKSKDGVNG